jgi:hypothetical protein
MKSRLTLAVLLAQAGMVLAPVPSVAGPASDILGQCLVNKTSGEERIMLIRWMSFAFAAHPQLQTSVTINQAEVEATNRAMADLFTALLADRCAIEARAAFVADGQTAFQQAFMVLGQVASQELALAPEVNAAMSGFIGFVDMARIEPLFQ